ncbi:MAG: hypothetical protein BHV99_05520 [Clostridium sp. 26_21]|nr:MAG: hypothetical protein BHV99_05520 [Clostridium sp. 26_21]
MNMHKFIKTIKRIKIKNLLILIILLLFNTYAWFIYSTKVNTEITAHVSSWNIKFVSDNQEITSDMTIEIERIFPGMEGDKKFEKIVQVKNQGEKSAILGYTIREITIMGETYTIGGENGKTEEELNKILDEYPFKIKIETNDENLKGENGEGKFIISLEWPFESGNDELDTYWGNKAYEYYSIHPDKNSVELKIILNASQKAE